MQEIAQTMELADKDIKPLQAGLQSSAPVFKLQESQPATQQPTKKSSTQYPNRGCNPRSSICHHSLPQVVVSKLNSVMCVARLATLQECVVADTRILVRDTQQMW